MCSHISRRGYYIINAVISLILAVTNLIIALADTENTSCNPPIYLKTGLWVSLGCFTAIAILCFLVGCCCVETFGCIIGFNICMLTMLYLVIVIFCAMCMFNTCHTFNLQFNVDLWSTNAAMFSISIMSWLASVVFSIVVCCTGELPEYV